MSTENRRQRLPVPPKPLVAWLQTQSSFSLAPCLSQGCATLDQGHQGIEEDLQMSSQEAKADTNTTWVPLGK